MCLTMNWSSMAFSMRMPFRGLDASSRPFLFPYVFCNYMIPSMPFICHHALNAARKHSASSVVFDHRILEFFLGSFWNCSFFVPVPQMFPGLFRLFLFFFLFLFCSFFFQCSCFCSLLFLDVPI